MSCELVEDDHSINYSSWQEIDAESETSQPLVVNITSLSFDDCDIEPKHSPVFPVDAFEQPVFECPQVSRMVNCHVALERLPAKLVHAAQMCSIFVSDKTAFQKSDGIDEAMVTQPFWLQDRTVVKTEPVEPVLDNEQMLFPSSTAELHLASVMSCINTDASVTDVATMTEAELTASNTTLCANCAGRINVLENDVSVILLNSAELLKTLTSDARDAAVSKLVVNMLRQQNINLTFPLNNDSISSTIGNESEQGASSCPVVVDLDKCCGNLL